MLPPAGADSPERVRLSFPLSFSLFFSPLFIFPSPALHHIMASPCDAYASIPVDDMDVPATAAAEPKHRCLAKATVVDVAALHTTTRVD